MGWNTVKARDRCCRRCVMKPVSPRLIRAGVRMARDAGHRVACAQLRHLNPLPANTGDVLRSFERVLVPELNSGQLASVLRARYLVDVEPHCKVRGQPLYAAEIAELIAERQ